MQATEEQAFDNDLLLTEEDRAGVAERFQELVRVLEFPELQTKFKSYEKRAERAKRARRRMGLLAIISSAIAVYGSSIEFLREVNLPRYSSWIFVTFGLLGALFGFVGIYNKTHKQRWLCYRLMSERLRQFHFQSLIALLSTILGLMRNSVERQQFLTVRHRQLAAFCFDYENHLQAHLKTVLDDDLEEKFWLLGIKPPALSDWSDANLNHVFAAYRLLRLQHQLQYANYKLYADEGFLPRSATRQRDILTNVSLAAILFIFALHLVIAALVGFDALWPPKFYLEMGVVWVAILALIARAFEEGLQPAREVERYARYRAELTRLLRRYDEASEPEAKIVIMIETEIASYREMRDFLKINYEARFAL